MKKIGVKKGIGNYFTTVENGANEDFEIGDYSKRELKSFVLNRNIKILKSTASNFNGNAGGGNQYFSPEIKNNITEMK